MASMLDMLMGSTDTGDHPRPASVAMDIERVRLADALAVWRRRYDLAVDDLVRAKVGVSVTSQTRGRPPTGAYVVLELRPEAEISWDVVAAASFGARFDLLLGFYDEDGDFIFSWTDSRRYEPLPEDAA